MFMLVVKLIKKKQIMIIDNYYYRIDQRWRDKDGNCGYVSY